MSTFRCVFEKHQTEEIAGICLGECNLRPWICMRCIVEKHQSHLEQCKTFPQIMKIIQELCRTEKEKFEIQKKKINELIQMQKNIQKEIEDKLKIYDEWICILSKKQYKDPKIEKMISQLKKYPKQIIQQQLKEDDPFEIDKLLKYSESLIQQKDYDQALLHLDKALEKEAFSVDALSHKGQYLAKQIGNCLRLMEKFEQALPYYEKALLFNPHHIKSLFGKGGCLRCLNNFHDALFSLDLALQQDSKYWQAAYEKGICLKKSKRYLEAIYEFERVLQINPQHIHSMKEKLFCEDQIKKQKS